MKTLITMSLDEIATHFGTDKATKHPFTPHGYAPHYERFFEPRRFDNLKVLEIGVGGGESIKTWLEYFPNAKVFGVDLVQDTNPWNTAGLNSDGLNSDRYTFVHGNQESEAFWTEFHAKHGGAWDIIIDDGGHEKHQIEASFNCMWTHINYGGFYCIEDLAYASPLDLVKAQIDRVHERTEVEWVYYFYELAIIKKK